jgi:hypothetical protein
MVFLLVLLNAKRDEIRNFAATHINSFGYLDAKLHFFSSCARKIAVGDDSLFIVLFFCFSLTIGIINSFSYIANPFCL